MCICEFSSVIILHLLVMTDLQLPDLSDQPLHFLKCEFDKAEIVKRAFQVYRVQARESEDMKILEGHAPRLSCYAAKFALATIA